MMDKTLAPDSGRRRAGTPVSAQPGASPLLRPRPGFGSHWKRARPAQLAEAASWEPPRSASRRREASAARPPAEVAAPPASQLLPRAAGARRPLARGRLRPGHAPASSAYLPGLRSPHHRAGGGLLGGSGLGSGRKLQGATRLGRARHDPRPGPARPPRRAPGKPRTAAPRFCSSLGRGNEPELGVHHQTCAARGSLAAGRGALGGGAGPQ